MKKFKKIYIEITNKCNLSCSFCPKDDLEKRDIKIDEFETILKKINNYTEYIYLHVKGEPLLHPEFSKIIDLGIKYNKKINITTNGTLMKLRKEDLAKVRQINISLQSLTKIETLYEIMDVADSLNEKVYISYRLWVNNKFESEIINILENRYNVKIEKGLNMKLCENTYIHFEKQFVWPSLENKKIRENGTCYGTREHIGILVDGTVIPCCLDSLGKMKLGNIFDMELEEIIKSNKFLKIKEGFENNKLEEEMCKKCGFFNRK